MSDGTKNANHVRQFTCEECVVSDIISIPTKKRKERMLFSELL
ncbi:hypothetical protein PLUTE_a1780 [Pseudoalteromonas luteoviolacea DSM 6061]|nr:hypothetical protein [Pseudoalteromonas luteoviolacea DSM 6061]